MWVKFGVLALIGALLGATGGCADQETTAGPGSGANAPATPSPGVAEDADSGSVSGSASCMQILTLEGATYVGIGGVRRMPVTTGVTATAILPGCNDTGDSEEQDDEVTIQELRDLPLEKGFAWNGFVFVHKDQPPLAEVVEWRTPLPCEVDGQFQITGDWVGITDPRGNTHTSWEPPYRLDVVVTDAPELFSTDDYASVQVFITVTDETDPTLGKDDGKVLRTSGATVETTVHCEGTKYVADAVAAHS